MDTYVLALMDACGFEPIGIATEISSDDFDTAFSGGPSTVRSAPVNK